MDVEQVAAALLERAADRGQAVLRCNNSTPTDDLRAAIRRLASQRNIIIRTGLIGDVLAVVLTDADIWNEPISVMRTKLPTPNHVQHRPLARSIGRALVPDSVARTTLSTRYVRMIRPQQGR